MELDVVSVTFNYLPRPTGAVSEFVKWLYEWKVDCSEPSQNLVFTYKQELLDDMEDYCEETDLDDCEKKEIRESITPTPEGGGLRE